MNGLFSDAEKPLELTKPYLLAWYDEDCGCWRYEESYSRADSQAIYLRLVGRGVEVMWLRREVVRE